MTWEQKEHMTVNPNYFNKKEAAEMLKLIVECAEAQEKLEEKSAK